MSNDDLMEKKTDRSGNSNKVDEYFPKESLPFQLRWLHSDIRDSISIMYDHSNEKPDKEKIATFIKTVSTCCKTILNIEDAQDTAVVIRAIAEINRGLGAPDNKATENFFIRTKEFCESKLNLTETSQIVRYIGSTVTRAPVGALDALYIRHLSLDPRNEIERIKEHCRAVATNEAANNYGDPNSFNIEAIDDYLASSNFPHSYRASFKEESLTSWDKLILSSKRFLTYFFDEADKAKGNNMMLYDKVIGNIAGYLGFIPKKIITPYEQREIRWEKQRKLTKGQVEQESLSTDIPEKDELSVSETACVPPKKMRKKHIVIATEVWSEPVRKRFLDALGQELAVRINWFIRGHEDHSLTAITSLARLTKPEALKAFFLSLLTSEIGDIRNYLKSKYQGTVLSIHSGRCKVPKLEGHQDALTFLENYATETLKVKPQKLIKPVMGLMQKGMGNPDVDDLKDSLDTIKEYCETKLNIKDPKLILQVICSIARIQQERGLPDKEALINFLEQIRIHCNEKFNITNPLQILVVINSIARMQYRRGIPEGDNLQGFLDKITEYCNTKLNINNPDNIIRLLKSISSMQYKHGIPESDSLINFLDTITEFCKTKLNIKNSTQILRFISSITGMQSGLGIPEINDLKKFLNTLNDYCETKLKIKKPAYKIMLIRSITGMQNRQGLPDTDKLCEFLDVLVEHYRTKIGRNNPLRILRFISSFTGMCNGRGVPEISDLKNFLNRFDNYCEKKLSHPSQFGRVLMSIASMQGGQGFPDFDKLETFLDTIINYCETKLNITDPAQIIKIISSITAMQVKHGIPDSKILVDFLDTIRTFCEKDLELKNPMQVVGLIRFVARMQKHCGIPSSCKLQRFLSNTKKYCETMLVIQDPLSITGVIHYITLIQSSRGAPTPKNLKCFFEIIKRCQDEMLKEKKELQVAKLLHFINKKRYGKGLPKSYNELKKLLKKSKKSLNDFALSKDDCITIDQVRDLAFQKDIPIKEIPSHNAKLFRTIEKCFLSIEKYFNLLCDLYGCETNEINKDFMSIIYNDPNKVKASNSLSKEEQDSILDAIELYQACRNTLIIINDRLVMSIANARFARLQSSDLSLKDDLIQAGRIGLLEGIDRFKPELGFNLSTYAKHWIDLEIRKQIFKNDTQISYSIGVQHAVAKYRKMTDEHIMTLTTKEIAKRLKKTEATIERYKRVSNPSVSLSQLAYDQEEGGTGSDVLTDTTNDPSEIAEANDLEDNRRRLIQFLLEGLSEKERDIITLHFGLNGEALTLEETGKVLSLTRERIRQIESRVLGKIRSKIIAHPELREKALELFFSDTNQEKVATTNQGQDEEKNDKENALAILMEDLDERERYLITKQFRLNGEKKLSCPKIAMQLSISEKSIYRMKFRALDKIRAKVLIHPELKQIADETFFNHVESSEDTGEETGELNDNS